MIELYLIRHALADNRGSKYPDDSQRPLLDKGHAQAKALADLFKKRGVQFDLLFSSPFTRAAQTAEPLATGLKADTYIQYVDALATPNYLELIAELKEWLSTDNQTIALVGHEPYLSELASLLLTGQTSQLSIDLKKSSFLCLTGPLEPNEMNLSTFLPFAWYKHF